MPGEQQWEGKTKGSLRGHKIFVFILRSFGLGPAYFILRFVAFYYFLFSKSSKSTFRYFRKIHGYKGLKLYVAAYRNYYVFGQVLLDRVALLSGIKTDFNIIRNGHKENLSKVIASAKGSILLSAHIGNWEIAGQMLGGFSAKLNILMYDNEIQKMKDFMLSVTKKRDFSIIGIRDGDMGHLVEIHKAFQNNEILIMHGDRFLPGNETLEKTFMNRRALFPAGPFILAAKFGVPIHVVFSVKEGKNTYHFFAKEPIEVKRSRSKEEIARAIEDSSNRYIAYLEDMLRKYPTQWFNFYDFWLET